MFQDFKTANGFVINQNWNWNIILNKWFKNLSSYFEFIFLESIYK